jgi:CheY-like chemotaxis protein
MRGNILVVEDNELNRDMLSRFLELFDYHIEQAVSGEQALSCVRSNQPDLILMDLSLPDIDGCEVTRRLKSDPATRPIPIIALTAHAMVGDREKCLTAGFDEYETKPVNVPLLTKKIEALLSLEIPA